MNSFFISDTHFSHAACLSFTIDDNGTKLRPQFKSVEEMDEAMVERWNSVVRPQDRVYHLGDVAMKRQDLRIIKRLNGHKRLVMGNHDIFEVKAYLAAGFEKVFGLKVLDRIIFSHIPLHPNSIGRFKANVHGHLHERVVTKPAWLGIKREVPDPRYISVCVEKTNYTPISFEDIKQRINNG